jgi:cytochrome d ubiquinol oxidase subunit I
VLGIVSLFGFVWVTWQSLHLKQVSNLTRTTILSVSVLPWISGALGLLLNVEIQYPWIIAGQLPSAMGLSTLTVNSLIISLIAYIGVYALLLLAAGLLLKQWLFATEPTEMGANA